MNRRFPSLRVVWSINAALALAAVVLSADHFARSSVPASPVDPTAASSRSAPRSEQIAADPSLDIAGKHAALDRDLITALQTDDAMLLRDTLRRAGMSDRLVRDAVQELIFSRPSARDAADVPDPAITNQWWKSRRQTSAQRDAAEARYQELRKEVVRLVGYDERSGGEDLSYLSPEKRQRYLAITADYNELYTRTARAARDFKLPSDAETLRLISTERQRDLDALLTPEERAERGFRRDPSAGRLTEVMSQSAATEEQFRQLLPLQRDFDALYGTDAARKNNAPAFLAARDEAERALQAHIREVTGDDAYDRSIRSRQADYMVARSAAIRLGLPDDTPEQVYATRDTVVQSTREIAENPHLSLEAKRAALAGLAAATRSRLDQLLGEEAAQAYFNNGGMPWLKAVEQGATLAIDARGEPLTKPLPGAAGATPAP